MHKNVYSNGKHRHGLDNWRTPFQLFQTLNVEFEFTVDAAADESNNLCDRFFTDALNTTWSQADRIFCNPPYSLLSRFLDKAHEPELSTFLLPVRTSAKWWLNKVLTNPNCHEIRFLYRNVKFIPPANIQQARHLNRAPMPCCVIIYRSSIRKGEIHQGIYCSDTGIPFHIITRGSKRGGYSTVLTPDQVDTVIRLYRDSRLSVRQLHERTGISQPTLYRIVQNLI